MKYNMQIDGKKESVINRLIVTGIALLTVFAVAILIAKGLDAFVWHIPR